MSNPTSGTQSGPGRPRDRRVDRAILKATEELLAARGYDELTIGEVAARAGVGRPTVYRRWPDKAHLVLATVGRSTKPSKTADTGTLKGDILAIHRRQVHLVRSSAFRTVVPALVARLGSDDELAEAYASDFVDLRRSELAAAVERAVARGEIDDPVDPDDLFDLLTGPLFYRAIVTGGRVTDAFAGAVARATLAELGLQTDD